MGQLIELIDFQALGPIDEIDVEQNALWDRFVEQADFANTWRDHESLDQLLETIGRLRSRIERSEVGSEQ